MKQRPILVAVIGYIIGIIWGLYLKSSIVPFYILSFIAYCIIKKILKNNQKNQFKLLSIKRYIRYLKIFINTNVILIMILFSIISNANVLIQNKKYNNIYKDGENIATTGIVVSQKIEKEYYNLYKMKTLTNENFYMYIQIKKDKEDLEYGDKISLTGTFVKPEVQRNYKGYDESKYLKTLKIVGKIKVNSITVNSKKQANFILEQLNNINLKIKQKINNTFDKEKAGILNGLLLGDKQNIEEELKQNFQILNISHILAISGMHIEYIISGIQILLKKIIGKKIAKIITIIILIIYVFITGFSTSIMRATIMGILAVSELIFHRKNDIWNSIAISLLIILIYNPFLILDIGLQLSYLGIIGIILFHSTILEILNKIKISKYIKATLSVTISAQILITPILLLNFHIISIYSLFTNLIVSIIIGPIIVLTVIGILLSFIFNPIINIFKPILSIGLDILTNIAQFSKLPFSKLYIPSPNIFTIIFYLVTIFIIKFSYKIYNQYKLNQTYKRIKNLISLFRYKFNLKKRKYIKYIIIIILCLIVFRFIPQNLKIYFVDIGQGDCTFIVTPKNKTILIDGGGSLSDNFDVGEKTLLPYLLNRGYNNIDYIIISHFDQDHVGRNFIFTKRNRSKKYNNW